MSDLLNYGIKNFDSRFKSQNFVLTATPPDD